MPDSNLHTLVVCDIDGCLNSGKLEPLDLPVLSAISKRISSLRDQQVGFTLCTGRPQPYAEAFSKILGITLPVICENGALLYHPEQDRSDVFVDDWQIEGIRQLERALKNLPWYGNGMELEPGKVASLSLSGSKILNMTHRQLDEKTAELKEQFTIYPQAWTHSSTAIDVTPQGIDKGTGLDRMQASIGFEQGQLIGIGDSSGDLPFLSRVTRIYCPANAAQCVLDIADVVAQSVFAGGVLKLLQSDSLARY